MRKVSETAISGRIDCSGIGSETPGAAHVEIFADNVSGEALLSALDLTSEERAAFMSTWEKICSQVLLDAGFRQVEDPPPPESTEG